MGHLTTPEGDGPNYARLFALRPEAYAGWESLNRAIRGGMDLRRYELVTLAAARRLGSSYCSMAHGTVLRDRFWSDVETGFPAPVFLPLRRAIV